MTFRFPTRQKARGEIDRFTFETPKNVDAQPGIVQGRRASSINEWFTAKALWALQMEFIYQYPLRGGTQRRGGIVVDFLVKAEPNWLPLEVQSERWHTGKFGSGERLRIAIIENDLKEKVRFVWEDDTMNQSDAIAAVKDALFNPPDSL